MVIEFFGVRGSLATPLTFDVFRQKAISLLEKYQDNKAQPPSDFFDSLPLEDKLIFGGNTPCVLVQNKENERIILDAGSGLRVLGNRFAGESNTTYHIFLSHFHWDHICGIPFFKPIYNPTNTVIFYSPSKKLSYALNRQQHEQHFPVSFKSLPAKRRLVILKENFGHTLGEFNIRPIKLNHPGGSYGYVVMSDKTKLSYLTDAEFTGENIEGKELFYKAIFESSDLIIMDTQYSLNESFRKIDWGHTSSSMAVNLSLEWRAKRLVTFHYDPDHSDKELFRIGKDAREQSKVFNKRQLEIIRAYEGLVLTI